MIKKIGGKYVVPSEHTGRVFGRYKTKKEAVKRLRQIEFFKHVRARKGFGLISLLIAVAIIAVLFVSFFLNVEKRHQDILQTGVSAEEKAAEIKKNIEANARQQEQQIRSITR